MKYLCLISHRQPGDEPGIFKDFEAGKEYEEQDIGERAPGHWSAVYGYTEGEKQGLSKRKNRTED